MCKTHEEQRKRIRDIKYAIFFIGVGFVVLLAIDSLLKLRKSRNVMKLGDTYYVPLNPSALTTWEL